MTSYFPAIDSNIFLRGKLNFVAMENAISYSPVCDNRPIVSDGVNPGPKKNRLVKFELITYANVCPKSTERNSEN